MAREGERLKGKGREKEEEGGGGVEGGRDIDEGWGKIGEREKGRC